MENNWIEFLYKNNLNGSSQDFRDLAAEILRSFTIWSVKNNRKLFYLTPSYINRNIFKQYVDEDTLQLTNKKLEEFKNYFIKMNLNSIEFNEYNYVYYNNELVVQWYYPYGQKPKNNTDIVKIGFRIKTTNEDLYKKLNKDFPNFFLKNKSLNENIYTLNNGESGLELISMGSFKKKLIETNYSKNVLSLFNDSISEINKKNPNGRLTILHGPPGTGKTYLLRSAINLVKDGLFIFIQPELFSRFSIIDLVKVLSSYNSKKIILLIEDADSILIDRKNNSEDKVSSILNLTDGFAAEFLNLHIIATTNIPKISVDEAYQRNGRLNKFIEIDKLTEEESNSAYNAFKIKNKPKYNFTEPTTLADIYSVAFGNSNLLNVENKTTKKIGFIR